MGELLALKDEAYGALIVIVSKLECQSGAKCRMIRYDNGTEFVNWLVKTFCEKNGIIHQTTVPYSPEQNSIAKRALATLFDMVRCMLHAAKLEARYWGEAYMYVVHIRRMSPTAAIEGKTPYEGWTNRKPNVAHLRIFGSIGYATIPKKLRGGKLGETSVKCQLLLLGWWTDETKGYRLENVETKKIFWSRDVKFIKDEKPTELAIFKSGSSSSLKLDDLGHSETSESATTDEDLDSESVQSEATTTMEPAPSMTNEPSPAKPTTSKWANLSPWEPSTWNHRELKQFGEHATEENIAESENQRVEHRTYSMWSMQESLRLTCFEAVGDSDENGAGTVEAAQNICMGARNSKG
jgi:hypothetical protein